MSYEKWLQTYSGSRRTAAQDILSLDYHIPPSIYFWTPSSIHIWLPSKHPLLEPFANTKLLLLDSRLSLILPTNKSIMNYPFRQYRDNKVEIFKNESE